MKTITLTRNDVKFSEGIVGATKAQYAEIQDSSVESNIVVVDAEGKTVCKVAQAFYSKLNCNFIGNDTVSITYTKALEVQAKFEKNVKLKATKS